jgi:hypothetical protein
VVGQDAGRHRGAFVTGGRSRGPAALDAEQEVGRDQHGLERQPQAVLEGLAAPLGGGHQGDERIEVGR